MLLCRLACAKREFRFGQMQRNASARCDCLEMSSSSKCQRMEAQCITPMLYCYMTFIQIMK